MKKETHDHELINLLDRVAAQDHDALRALYDLCATKLFGLAVRVVGNREWAEDVLQESFMSIWRSAGDYRASLSPPMAWLGLCISVWGDWRIASVKWSAWLISATSATAS